MIIPAPNFRMEQLARVAGVISIQRLAFSFRCPCHVEHCGSRALVAAGKCQHALLPAYRELSRHEMEQAELPQPRRLTALGVLASNWHRERWHIQFTTSRVYNEAATVPDPTSAQTPADLIRTPEPTAAKRRSKKIEAPMKELLVVITPVSSDTVGPLCARLGRSYWSAPLGLDR